MTLPRRVGLAAAPVLVIVLGITVCISWVTHFDALLSLIPGAAPMQFNTALLFAVSGFAVLNGIRGHSRVGSILSAVVLVFSSVTAVQYLFGSDFGIDELFVRAHYVENVSHAGRMAPNTACAFIVLAAATGLMCLGVSPYTTAILGVLVLTMGGTALAGYVIASDDFYGWGSFTRMAAHTAFCFTILGAAIITQASLVIRAESWRELPWVGALVGVAIALGSAIAWNALHAMEKGREESMRRAVVDAAAGRFAAHAQEWVLALDRLLRRTESRLYPTREAWRSDAQSYLEQMGAIDHIVVTPGDDSRNVLEVGSVPPGAGTATDSLKTSLSRGREANNQPGVILAVPASDYFEIHISRESAKHELWTLTAAGSLSDLIAVSAGDGVAGNSLMLRSIDRDPANAPEWRRVPSPFTNLAMAVSAMDAGPGITVRWPDGVLLLGLAIAVLAAFSVSQARLLYRAKSEAQDALTQLFATSLALKKLAMEDPLTGASNRRQFVEGLKTEFSKSRQAHLPLSVAIIDLDHFKQVNDTFGHAVGDEVLKTVVATIASILRPGELLARYGGEEFALLVPRSPQSAMTSIAQRILSAVRGIEMQTDEGRVTVTCSIGCSSLAERHSTPQEMLKEADERLYRAKAQGRDQAVTD